MYAIKPIIDPSHAIYLPKCMYKMKNIHGQNESINHVENHRTATGLDISEQDNGQVLPEMTALEERQRRILDQLEQLKTEMQNIRSELKLCAKPYQGESRTNEPNSALKSPQKIEVENLKALVIKVKPTNVPYSLLVLQRLWADQLGLSCNIYTHSSVKVLPEDAKMFADQLKSFIPKLHVPQLDITLIWKNVTDLEVLVSATRVAISGELNLLRYLSRIGPSSYNYENDELKNSMSVDSVLDMSYRLVQSTTKTDRQTYLRNLNAKLGKSDWFAANNKQSIADVAVYSALLQCALTNDLTVQVSKWFKRVQHS